MFPYNLRSATALLTIISILGPNIVCAMESDEPEVRSIVLRAPTPELREAETALIVHPQTEEPASMKEEAAPNVQSQAIIVAPITVEAPSEGYFARTYSAIASGLSTVGNGLYNAGSVVANGLTEGTSEARRGASVFIKGVDLYPIMQQTVPAMRQARQEAVEYWNQPSADQPAALKNIMVGFTREMGPNLHHLLINANRILGPEFTAKLVQSTGLTQRVGTMVGNNMMKLSNPLGWGTTLITLTQIGFNVADLKQDGLFGLAKRKIAKIAAKKVGLPEDYMRREQEVLKTEQTFLEEAEKWCQYQREHPADESEDSWVITNWFARLANNISNTHSYPRNKEWNDAAQAYHTAQTNLDKAKDEFYAKNGTFKGAVLMVAYESWVKALLNTLRKTLTSFADDLESKLTTEYIPEMTASLVKDTLRAFILGYESSLKPVIEQGKELSSNAKEITDAVNTVTRNPMAILRNLAPEVITNAANDLSNMVNAGVGHIVGGAATGFTENTIRELNLREIDMFQPRELDLHINDMIQNGQLPDTVKTALDYTGDLLGFEELAQRLLQSAGKQAAVRFSNILGNFVLEKVNEASSKKYTLEELMTQEIDYSLWTRTTNTLTSWFK